MQTPKKREHKVIGITGGIASGKSSVAAYLVSKGYPVIDADKTVHQLLAPGGKAEPLVLEHFGTTDRAELRKKVFQNPAERKALEAILHPLVAAESERQFAELGEKHSLIFYEATLLIEAGRHSDLDGVWVVTAPLEQRLARIQARNGYTKEEALLIINAQSSDAFRIAHATQNIENKGSLDELKNAVDAALLKI